MSGQDDSPWSITGNTIGMARLMGNHFVMNVNYGILGYHQMPLANLFQHEASHLFNCDDHKQISAPWCVMSYINNAFNRAYCGDCDTALWRNRHHYDVKGFPVTATNLSNGGSVTNKDAILWLTVDGSFARLNSGGYGSKAVLNVELCSKDYQWAYLSGNVHLRGYTGQSAGNHLLVYASSDNVNWYKIKDINFYTYGSGGETLIDCGYVSNIRYLSIVVYNDYNYVGDVYLNKAHILN
jgi:hypothetical protein